MARVGPQRHRGEKKAFCDNIHVGLYITTEVHGYAVALYKLTSLELCHYANSYGEKFLVLVRPRK